MLALGSPGTVSPQTCRDRDLGHNLATDESRPGSQSSPAHRADGLRKAPFQHVRAGSASPARSCRSASPAHCALQQGFGGSPRSVKLLPQRPEPSSTCTRPCGAAASYHVEARPRLQLQLRPSPRRLCRASMHASQLCAAAGGAALRRRPCGTANRVGCGGAMWRCQPGRRSPRQRRERAARGMCGPCVI